MPIIVKILIVYAVVMYIVWFVLGILDEDDDDIHTFIAMLWPIALTMLVLIWISGLVHDWSAKHSNVAKWTARVADIVTLPLRPLSFGRRAAKWFHKLRSGSKPIVQQQ